MNVFVSLAFLASLLGLIAGQLTTVQTANGAGQGVEGLDLPSGQIPGEDCPSFCTFLLSPVCGAQWFDRFQTFPNDCVRRYRNCRSSESFAFVCNGTCVFEQGRAEQKQSTPIQPTKLCKPWRGL